MTTVSRNKKDDVESGSRRAMNSTAYRIFKLLQWLIEGPVSVPALNEKFYQDPRIGKSVSTDSIWLYINTLKALGCRIRRPSPKNQFCYELLSHPFGLNLTEQHFELLAQVKAYAQQHFNHQDILLLDRLLKKIVSRSNLLKPDEAIEQLFVKSRSYDYAACETHLRLLEKAVETSSLLEIGYASPTKGQEKLIFLPETLFYEKGVVYLRGDRLGQTAPSNLRLEKILSIRVLSDETVRQKLLAQREQKTLVKLRLSLAPEKHFDGFGLSENQGVYTEQVTWDENRQTCDIHLQIRETFYLKQQLLACEHTIEVLEPESLREELRATLETMQRLYTTKEN
ncbi:MAG TPA: WYL domain-containing protein [Oculatellaceae cyanobacterium]